MRLILLRGNVPINFPPLRRGGQGGGGVHAWDIVNGFPLSQSRDNAGGRRPFERPVVGCARITPPGPPLRKGRKRSNKTGIDSIKRQDQLFTAPPPG